MGGSHGSGSVTSVPLAVIEQDARPRCRQAARLLYTPDMNRLSPSCPTRLEVSVPVRTCTYSRLSESTASRCLICRTVWPRSAKTSGPTRHDKRPLHSPFPHGAWRQRACAAVRRLIIPISQSTAPSGRAAAPLPKQNNPTKRGACRKRSRTTESPLLSLSLSLSS
jgi:hypothetical protein